MQKRQLFSSILIKIIVKYKMNEKQEESGVELERNNPYILWI